MKCDFSLNILNTSEKEPHWERPSCKGFWTRMQKEEMIARQHPSIVYKYSRMLFHFLKFESFTENE